MTTYHQAVGKPLEIFVGGIAALSSVMLFLLSAVLLWHEGFAALASTRVIVVVLAAFCLAVVGGRLLCGLPRSGGRLLTTIGLRCWLFLFGAGLLALAVMLVVEGAWLVATFLAFACYRALQRSQIIS
jgi:hypothetical protein